MFANMGVYPPCGIFTIGHFILITLTIIGIAIALKYTINKNKSEVHKIIKYVTITAWILELIKIIFNVRQNSFRAVNTYIPLYYCSMLLYAGLFSSFAKGWLKKVGDVSLATGSIIGGVVFMIYPSTSLPIYPAYHFLSIQSFLYHGAMVYLGILINKTKYIDLKIKDIKYFACLVGIMSVMALVVNKFFDGNLMFISNNFPNTPIEMIYKMTNGGMLYTLIMVVAQMTLPFYIAYFIIKKICYFLENKENKKSLMKLKSKNKEIFLIIIILIIQTIIFVIAGINKSYIHIDEAYSHGLANYEKIEIQDNIDFYNNWHNKDYYADYLVVNENEKTNFLPVYENQKNDVHPPLYYLLLRIAMGFNIGKFSKWSGIILNIIIYIFITIFTYLIVKKVLNESIKKSAIITLMTILTLASISNVIFIRMYALTTLNILITTYLHLKLLDKSKSDYKILTQIGLSALIGSLTHYYYLFYLFALALMFFIKYLRKKEYKELIKYICTLLLAGALSIIIFPYSIKHIFLGYRGKEAISGFGNISKIILNIIVYTILINLYGFNNTLFIILICILSALIYKKIKKVKIPKSENKYIKYIIVPSIFYAVLVAITSPFIALRYMFPICGLLFIIILYYGMKYISKNNKFIAISCLILLIMPALTNSGIQMLLGKIFINEKEDYYESKSEVVKELNSDFKEPIEKISEFANISVDDTLLYIRNFVFEPDVIYSNKKNIVKFIKENANLPTIYFFNSNYNRFLDDILLFTYINESYIAKDIDYSEEIIKQVTFGKDISNGLIIFINDGQNNDEIINVIKKSLGLNNVKYIERLNSSDVYLLK